MGTSSTQDFLAKTWGLISYGQEHSADSQKVGSGTDYPQASQGIVPLQQVCIASAGLSLIAGGADKECVQLFRRPAIFSLTAASSSCNNPGRPVVCQYLFL